MNQYKLDIDDSKWVWEDYMLEPVETAPDSNGRYKLHRDLLDVIHETYKRKNEAYGNSFDLSIDKYGPTAALVRIEDKKNRLDQLLLEGGEEHDEAVEDTCLDMANYCIMLAMYLTEHNRSAEPKRK